MVAMGKTLDDGEKVTVQGSSSEYELHRQGSVYSCSCPAWRNQGAQIGFRTCKHLRAYLGDEHETRRIGSPASAPTSRSSSSSSRSSSGS
jgi:DNA ligase-1